MDTDQQRSPLPGWSQYLVLIQFLYLSAYSWGDQMEPGPVYYPPVLAPASEW